MICELAIANNRQVHQNMSNLFYLTKTNKIQNGKSAKLLFENSHYFFNRPRSFKVPQTYRTNLSHKEQTVPLVYNKTHI